MLSRPRSLALAGVAGLLLGFGCGSKPALPLFQDLAATASVADLEAPWQTIRFGTLAGEPHQEHGFLRDEVQGERLAWTRRRPDVLLKWSQVAPRIALLDASLPDGLTTQSAATSLNGTPIGVLALGSGRARYRIELPESAQRVGTNRLSFVFKEVTSPKDPEAPRLAAGFHSLSVGAPDSALPDLLAREAPAPFAVDRSSSVPSIHQAGPSVLRYAFRAPAEAELRFTPSLHPSARSADGSVRLWVGLETEGVPERELWSGVPRDGAGEVVVALPASEGKPLRLSLHVEGSRFAWGVWRAPRILARPAPAPSASASPMAVPLKDANVLLVVLDAAGAAHFGCYGYPRETTPEIDRLAKEGVLFEHAVTPAVFTLSAMASVWTSQYHDQHHEGAAYDAGLPTDRLTLAELLSAQAIHTTSIVANGMAGRAFGLDRGFTEYHQVPAPFTADKLRALVPPLLEANRNRRFFAYLHFREPHFPYDPGPPFGTRFGPDAPLGPVPRNDMHWINGVNARSITATPEERAHLLRLYDGNLARADHEVGEVRKALEAAGLWQRTVVIVTADHGEAMGEHGFIGHNEQLYQESVQVPLILRLPGGPSGKRVGELVDLLGIAPMVAEVFGLRGQGGWEQSFQGQSLLGAALGAHGRDHVLSRSAGEQPKYAWRDQRFKLILNTRYGQEELYDLEVDADEQHDIAAKRPLLAACYRQLLRAQVQSLHRGGREPDRAPELTSEQRDNLKALGYIQ